MIRNDKIVDTPFLNAPRHKECKSKQANNKEFKDTIKKRFKG